MEEHTTNDGAPEFDLWKLVRDADLETHQAEFAAK